jgi:chromosome segregation ATPase
VNQEKDSLSQNLESIKVHLETVNQERDALTQDLESTKVQLETVRREKEDLSQNLESDKAQFDTLSSELKNLEEARNKQEQEMQKILTSVEKLEAELEAKSQIEANLTSDIAAREAELVQLRVTLQEHGVVEQQAKSERENLLSSQQNIQLERNELQGQVTDLEQQMRQVLEDKDQLKAQVEVMEAELKKTSTAWEVTREEAESLRLRLVSETALAAEKSAELEQVLVQGQELATKVDGMDEEIGRLQLELEDQMAKCKAAEAMAEEARSLLEATRREKEKTAAENVLQAEQLHAGLQAAKAEHVATLDQLSAATSSADQIKLELKTAQQELDNLRAACRVHSEEIENLKDLLQAAREERNSKLQKSADRYNKLAILHDELKEELKAEQAKVAIGLEEVERVHAENQLVGPTLGKSVIAKI